MRNQTNVRRRFLRLRDLEEPKVVRSRTALRGWTGTLQRRIRRTPGARRFIFELILSRRRWIEAVPPSDANSLWAKPASANILSSSPKVEASPVAVETNMIIENEACSAGVSRSLVGNELERHYPTPLVERRVYFVAEGASMSMTPKWCRKFVSRAMVKAGAELHL